MKVSYLITTHNEAVESSKVFDQVFQYANPSSPKYRGDEVVVLDDYSTDEKMIGLLKIWENTIGCKVIKNNLNKDFGAHKTFGSRQCSGNFIFQIDADEFLSDSLIENLHELIDANPDVELYRVPRVNIVRGITQEDVNKWGWKVYSLPEFSGLPIVNWEHDYQSRLYKNDVGIYWHKKLHETITGENGTATLPLEVDYAIIHDKTIDRQRAQNIRYMNEWTEKENRGII